MNISAAISQFASEHNCLSGIADPAPIAGLRERLEQTETPFVSKSMERRLSPAAHLPGVKSVIALGVPYAPACGEISPLLAAPGEPYTGLISSMAISADYHRTVRALLEELVGRVQPGKYRILVDSGGLVEREWAVKAGLGFWGKNCCVISPAIGSFFYIGLLLTDLDISATTDTVSPACGDCTLCISACPGKALSPYRLDYRKCVSYITQKEGVLTPEEESIMGRHIYGCDACQRACPYNKGVLGDYPSVSLKAVMDMSEGDFDRTCKNTPMGWKGLKILRRNAANVFRSVYNRR